MSRKNYKNKIENLTVLGLNSKGVGVAKLESGEVCFVKDTVPGDIVNIEVYKKKRNYFEASPLSYIKKSKDRQTPKCEHFGVCGGCKLQHIKYEAQLIYKEKKVLDDLKNIGKIDINEFIPIAGAEPFYDYRNKMEFSFTNKKWITEEEIKSEKKINRDGVGLHIPNMWDKVIDIQKCYLQGGLSNSIRNGIKAFAVENKISFFDPKEQNGFLRTLMIRNNQKGDTMVLLQFFYKNTSLIKKVLTYVKINFPMVSSLLYIVNSKPNDSIYDQNIICFSGKDYIEECIENLNFKITAKSFYQTNPKQAVFLYKKVEAFAGLKGNEIVYDLYCGTGTISLFLAKNCKKIIGIESVSDTVNAAKENAVKNKIENVEFELGDMKNIFNEGFISKHGKAEVVITDPPRNGMHSNVIEQLINLAPEKIVYVSCNSSTQARDLSLLKPKYDFIKSQAIDMFPQTHHVENIVLLKKK